MITARDFEIKFTEGGQEYAKLYSTVHEFNEAYKRIIRDARKLGCYHKTDVYWKDSLGGPHNVEIEVGALEMGETFRDFLRQRADYYRHVGNDRETIQPWVDFERAANFIRAAAEVEIAEMLG